MNVARICVVQQAESCGPGQIAEVFARHGVAWDLCHAGDGEALPDVHDAAGFLLLGGPMSVNDPLDFLAAQMRLIEEAVRLDAPVLGVCLGAQLVAKALGARVRKADVPEIGWTPVWLTTEGTDDALITGIRPGDPVMQWHNETFDLPHGAVRLAYSEHCENQAFRLGNRVHAVQFHPEATPGIIRQWIAADDACGDQREATTPIDPMVNEELAASLAESIFGAWIDGIDVKISKY